jgi:hypothetical protein
MKYYMIYGKHRNDKRFKPLDYSEGIFVTNRIYASMFREYELPRVKKAVDFMNKNNKDYMFEVRTI